MNTLFVLLIIGVALSSVLAEIKSISDYCQKQCGPTAQAIKILKEHLVSGGNGINLDDKMRGWFLQHLDGEMRENLFFPTYEGNTAIMLSSPTVLGKPIPRGPVYFAPTLLTALGVLGTFAGIYQGLQGVNLDIQEADTLLKSSTDLLAGMKFAFLTSLWGLGSSSIFMLFLAFGERVRQGRRDSLRSELSKVAFLLTPVRILARMTPGATGGQSNLTAAAIGQAVATEMRSVLRSELSPMVMPLTKLTPEAIGQATGGYFRGALHEELTPTLNSMNAELSSIRKLQEKQGQAVDYLVTRLREELIEPVVKRLEETAKLTKEASEAVKELKTALGDITKELAEAVKTIQEFQKVTLEELKQFAGSLAAILDKFRDETRGVLLTVAEEIKRAVAESIKGMEAQREAFALSAAQAAESFRGIRKELEQSLDTQAKQQKAMLEGVEASTRKVLEDANQAFISQSETLVNLGGQAAKVMDDAAKKLNETLQKTRETVQEELEKFRLEYQESLTEFFKAQNNLLDETLRKQREGLAIVIAKLQTVFLEDAPKMGEVIKEAMGYMQETIDYMQGTIASIQDTAKIVYNLANKTGLTSGERLQQLTEMIRELGSEANQIESAYQNMVEKFEKSLNQSLNLMVERLNDALQIGNKQLMEYLTKANESYTKSIKEGDVAAAKVCQQLNQTAQSLDQSAHGLMDVSHYLVASAKELKNGNGSGN
ncbi:hypothetical protein NG799_17150 [Laspinema sp. D1]|uniref:MotA/TolQ/ExbB proton channel domain-containing protein n=1 Tax=Laspinema palackyanum D2a TaxID=2953684 RepID=A0ABT2MVW0_9CYAN|nr:hypothetical protein [Laspinema sp. D2a]